jgi:hypothetical protein
MEGLDAALALETFGIALLAEIYDGLSFPASLAAPTTPAAATGCTKRPRCRLPAESLFH